MDVKECGGSVTPKSVVKGKRKGLRSTILLDILVLVIHLRRLKHARDAHCSFSLLLFPPLCFSLFLLQEEIRVVARKLLQLDQEIAQRQFETVDIAIIFP